LKLSRYCIIYPDPKDTESVFLFSTKQGSAVRIDKAQLSAVENGSLDEEDRYTLAELGLLINSEQEERLEMLRFIDEINEVDAALSVVATLNLDCNLACPYCFEGSRRGKHYMSPETAGQLIKFIEKGLVAGKDEFRIGFYGGEPLLSINLLQDIACGLKDIAEKKGVRFSFSLTTNGTLLNSDIVSRLKPLGLKTASVTLDGPEHTHNVSRPFANGAGSFRRIIDNIRDVCDDIEIEIGGNFSRDNYREFPQLLDRLIIEGITPDKIKSIAFTPALRERDGIVLPDYTGGCCNITEPWLFEVMPYLRGEIMSKGFPIEDVSPAICVVERKSMIIVNFDGGIYKCPGLIGQSEFKVGDIVNGIGDYSVSYGMDIWKRDECLDCIYLPLCFGGCRYMNLLSGNNIAALDCRKPYYDACLEGLVRQDLEISRRQASEA
jgi:uncharacterized protein